MSEEKIASKLNLQNYYDFCDYNIITINIYLFKF